MSQQDESESSVSDESPILLHNGEADRVPMTKNLPGMSIYTDSDSDEGDPLVDMALRFKPVVTPPKKASGSTKYSPLLTVPEKPSGASSSGRLDFGQEKSKTPKAVKKTPKEPSLPPRKAHRLPPPTNGGRAVASFKIPRHEPGSSKVYTRMKMESRGRLDTGTGNTFEAYSSNISRFIFQAGVVARKHGLEYDGDVDSLAIIVAKYGQDVYKPVIDVMAATPGSSPRSQASCCDAFIRLCTWLKTNMGATQDAVNLMTLIDNVTIKKVQKDKAEANRLQRQRQTQVTVQSMENDDRWIKPERLQRLGSDAYAYAIKEGAIISRQKLEGLRIKPNTLSSVVSSVVATVVIGAHTSRQGPMSQMSLADMEKLCSSANGARYVTSGQHKNSTHEDTPTISIDFNHPKVQEVLKLYQDVLRPLLVESAKSRKNSNSEKSETSETSADSTGHFWISRENTPMKFGKVFSRYVEKMTRGEAKDGVSGLRIGTTAVRRTIATTVEHHRRQGNISNAEAELVHRADGHSGKTAVKYYAIGAQQKEQSLAGDLISRLGIGLDPSPVTGASKPDVSKPGASNPGDDDSNESESYMSQSDHFTPESYTTKLECPTPSRPSNSPSSSTSSSLSPSWGRRRQDYDSSTPSFWEQMGYSLLDTDSPHYVRDDDGERVTLGDGSGRYREKWYRGAGRSVPPSPPIPPRSSKAKRMPFTNEESYWVRWWMENKSDKYSKPQALWDALEHKLKNTYKSKNPDPICIAFGPTHRTSKALKDHATRGMKVFDWGGTLTEEGITGTKKMLKKKREEEFASDTDRSDEEDLQRSRHKGKGKKKRKIFYSSSESSSES